MNLTYNGTHSRQSQRRCEICDSDIAHEVFYVKIIFQDLHLCDTCVSVCRGNHIVGYYR